MLNNIIIKPACCSMLCKVVKRMTKSRGGLFQSSKHHWKWKICYQEAPQELST